MDAFKLTLLTVASVVAFRTMRDAWFLCLIAAASSPDAIFVEAENSERWWEKLGIAAAAVGFDQRGLDQAISADYPVNALNYLRRNPASGPLYNNLNWGGFLMWYMPDLPVAIDGRNDLYGDELDKVFYGSQNAEPSYKTDPYLNEAGVVLLDSEVPLAKVLTIDPRFQLVYHDQIATVFARR